MIYFIRDPVSCLVKIGYSADAWKRLTKIQSDSPGLLQVEAVIPGDRVDEVSMHQRFLDQRVRGEWFNWSGPVAAYIATVDRISRPTTRDPAKTRINKAMVRLGFSPSYGSRLQSGQYQWGLPLAVAIWKECGEKVGPIANASADELAVLAKYAVFELPTRAPGSRLNEQRAA